MTNMNYNDGTDPIADGVPEVPGGEESGDGMGDAGAFMSGEEKKPGAGKGVLVLLGLVLVGGGGYFYMKQGPAAADAATAQGPDTVTRFLSDGDAHVKMMKQMLNNSEKVVQRFRQYPTDTQIPLTSLRSNPFRLLPPKGDEPVVRHADPEGDREAVRQKERKAAATDAAQKLRLQSIFSSGTTKACLINGKLYRLGQQVDGFTIEEIEPTHVIVSMYEFKFSIAIQR